MNRNGEKLASRLRSYAVCKPAAACNPAIDPALPDILREDIPLLSALVLGETVGILYALARLV